MKDFNLNTTKISSLMLALVFAIQIVKAEESVSVQDQGKVLIQQFSLDLKTTLQSAIKEGGLKNAISVCSEKAPGIADKYTQNGWHIKRTSLRVRNSDNTPTNDERDILLQFQVKKDEGIPISDLEFYEAVNTEKGARHRMIKAIPAQALCLACHGENISEELKSELSTRYPNDQATGFKEGDIRGAFSLIFTETESIK